MEDENNHFRGAQNYYVVTKGGKRAMIYVSSIGPKGERLIQFSSSEGWREKWREEKGNAR